MEATATTVEPAATETVKTTASTVEATASTVEAATTTVQAATTAEACESWCGSEDQGQQHRAKPTCSPHNAPPEQRPPVLLLFLNTSVSDHVPPIGRVDHGSIRTSGFPGRMWARRARVYCDKLHRDAAAQCVLATLGGVVCVVNRVARSGDSGARESVWDFRFKFALQPSPALRSLGVQ
jgi:hypothetical protein